MDDIEGGGGGNAAAGADLDKFFEDVENVKKDMKAVEVLYKKLQEANEESKTAHNAKTMKDLRSRMDADVSQAGPGLRPGILHRQDEDVCRERAGEEAKDDDGRLPGAEGEDELGVQGDGGEAVLHRHGGAAGRGAHREPDIERGERVVPAEGDPGAGAGPDPRHHIGDSRTARRGEGDREEPDRAAPDIPGHGGAGGGAGAAAQFHREPRGPRELLRPARDGAAPRGTGVVAVTDNSNNSNGEYSSGYRVFGFFTGVGNSRRWT
ncbi:hypothetical protein DM860_017746 [Cuscuta australis]|uniref:Syntaxin N-terminal domain-containing protein n=1 Tax=Cuscuta australis TaxID=267555 RepID=A0A328D5W2_9ASTE|nr:hypothetical protein DM860_017746 [Cuscuta australis]